MLLDAVMGEHGICKGGLAIATRPKDGDAGRTRAEIGENHVNDLGELGITSKEYLR
jgi:hypothetical protein